jgi:hypothetical protein
VTVVGAIYLTLVGAIGTDSRRCDCDPCRAISLTVVGASVILAGAIVLVGAISDSHRCEYEPNRRSLPEELATADDVTLVVRAQNVSRLWPGSVARRSVVAG